MTKPAVATAILALLVLIPSALTFAPAQRAAFGVRTPPVGSGLSVPSPTAPLGMLLDDDFDGVDLVRVLGLRRLKKIARRHRLEAESAGAAEEAAGAVGGEAEPAGEPLRLIISGAPASGKGTQCEFIREKYGVVHLSTGDMLRAAVADGTDVGKAAKGYMDAGKLVPDEVIIGVVKDRLDQLDCRQNGWLLDGFPRTPAQAQALTDAGVTADCFLFLDVPDSILVERVVGRRTDPETGKIYHMTFSPPEDEEVVGRLVQRSDDTEEKVRVRLAQFHDNVDAVRDGYADIGVQVDGSQSPAEVTAAIDAAIAEKVAVKRAAA